LILVLGAAAGLQLLYTQKNVPCNGQFCQEMSGQPLRPLHGSAADSPLESRSTISNFAGIELPAPLKVRVDAVANIDSSGLDAFHSQLLLALSKSESVSNKIICLSFENL